MNSGFNCVTTSVFIILSVCLPLSLGGEIRTQVDGWTEALSELFDRAVVNVALEFAGFCRARHERPANVLVRTPNL